MAYYCDRGDDENHFVFKCAQNENPKEFSRKLIPIQKEIRIMYWFKFYCLSCPSVLKYAAPFIKTSLSQRRVDLTTA